MNDFPDSMGYGRVGDFAMDMLDSEMVVNDDDQMLWIRRLKERNLIHTPAWLIAARQRLLDFILTKPLNSSTCSGIGGDMSHLSDSVGYFQSC